jgi:hypothetical protein
MDCARRFETAERVAACTVASITGDILTRLRDTEMVESCLLEAGVCCSV